MRRLTLDTTNCSTRRDLHEALKNQLGFPDYYGETLDACWDCLTSDIKVPLSIEWRGYPEARAAIGEYVDELLETLRQAEKELNEFKVEVKLH